MCVNIGQENPPIALHQLACATDCRGTFPNFEPKSRDHEPGCHQQDVSWRAFPPIIRSFSVDVAPGEGYIAADGKNVIHDGTTARMTNRGCNPDGGWGRFFVPVPAQADLPAPGGGRNTRRRREAFRSRDCPAAVLGTGENRAEGDAPIRPLLRLGFNSKYHLGSRFSSYLK